MKPENQENRKSEKAASARKTKVAPAKKAASNKDFTSELNSSHWSVVSFETCLASGLTYDIAAKKMKRFTAKKISGLCIITDEAASRIKN